MMKKSNISNCFFVLLIATLYSCGHSSSTPRNEENEFTCKFLLTNQDKDLLITGRSRAKGGMTLKELIDHSNFCANN